MKRLLFIRESQVATCKLELQNNPLKLEVSALTKRVQDEQEKARLESMRLKQRIKELMNNGSNLITEKVVRVEHSLASVRGMVDGETQTLDLVDLTSDETISDARRICKYREMEKICRSRYHKIKELEALLENKKDNTAKGSKSPDYKVN